MAGTTGHSGCLAVPRSPRCGMAISRHRGEEKSRGWDPPRFVQGPRSLPAGDLGPSAPRLRLRLLGHLVARDVVLRGRADLVVSLTPGAAVGEDSPRLGEDRSRRVLRAAWIEGAGRTGRV